MWYRSPSIPAWSFQVTLVVPSPMNVALTSLGSLTQFESESSSTMSHDDCAISELVAPNWSTITTQ